MVIITFADGQDWFKANWVFRQLAEDITARKLADEPAAVHYSRPGGLDVYLWMR